MRIIICGSSGCRESNAAAGTHGTDRTSIRGPQRAKRWMDARILPAVEPDVAQIRTAVCRKSARGDLTTDQGAGSYRGGSSASLLLAESCMRVRRLTALSLFSHCAQHAWQRPSLHVRRCTASPRRQGNSRWSVRMPTSATYGSTHPRSRMPLSIWRAAASVSPRPVHRR